MIALRSISRFEESIEHLQQTGTLRMCPTLAWGMSDIRLDVSSTHLGVYNTRLSVSTTQVGMFSTRLSVSYTRPWSA